MSLRGLLRPAGPGGRNSWPFICSLKLGQMSNDDDVVEKLGRTMKTPGSWSTTRPASLG